MYSGWMMLAGNEIINTARTEAYCAAAGTSWFKPCSDCDGLNAALGDAPYASPLVDEAPWFDADDPDTWRFYGVYPLDISGADDSVRQAPVTEALGDGGVVGPLRHATRSIVVTGVAIGADECAVEAGMSWLRWTAKGSNCQTSEECVGDDLCFLACCPEICDDDPDYPDGCLNDYIRTFRLATITEGPQVTAKHELSDGGVAWEITFTIVCAVPWSYGTPISIYDGAPFPSAPISVTNEPVCPDDVMPDYHDPYCPALPLVPTVPAVPLSCFALPTQWDRYVFPLPASAIRTWQDSVPTVTIKTGNGDGIHNIRLRFYADPLARQSMDAVNACDFCGEFLINYVPANATFEVDGGVEQITVTQVSAQKKTIVKDASSMVMSSNGGPFVWPLITCGYAYLLVVDLAHGEDHPSWLSIDMTPRGV